MNSDHLRKPVRHAIVVGGGLAGILTAAALTDHAEAITVIERDVLPQAAEPRRGLPQARHAHLLYSGGARAIESILPGTEKKWLDAGAHRISLPTGLVSLSSEGWLRRWPEMQYLIACSRDLLDLVVREQVLARSAVTLRDGTEVTGLAGNAQRVTGVTVRDCSQAAEALLEADFVVDAGGRGSSAPQWLSDLGVSTVRQVDVDSGLAYATRIFKAPSGAEGFPVVGVQPDPRQPVPGQSATIVPVEGGRWLVTLSGTRGGHPSKKPEEFEPFARQVRHPVVADLIRHAEPLTDVHVSHSTVNHRRLYEKLNQWPAGFIALGDSVATYNPIYGQGMSVAAQSAYALRDILRARDPHSPETSRFLQRTISRIVQGPWDLATGQDILYPGATGPQPPAAARILRGYMDRLTLTAGGRPATCRALLDTITLSTPLTHLLTPTVAVGVLRGPKAPPLAQPPLTAREKEFTQRSTAHS